MQSRLSGNTITDGKRSVTMKSINGKFLFGLFTLFFLYQGPMLAQNQDTIPPAVFELPAADTLPIDSSLLIDPASGQKYPNPKKAAILSLALPGAGQVYNKRWWKLPFVYAALGGVVYAIDYNSGLYKRFREALILERADQPHEFSGLSIGTEQALLNKRDEFDKNRQLAYVGLFAVYALTAVEAFVDAHLKNFDIDEELGFELRPQLETVPLLGQPIIGMGVHIPLDKKRAASEPKVFFTTE